MTEESYKIISLEAENFKRLQAVEIRPDGALVQIAGRNRAGKSSVLDAIWVALQGLAVAPPEPIRQGAERATIRLDMGELIVTRTFTRKDEGGFGGSLKVESPDGRRFSSPQKVLDEIVGALTLDPLAFERMDAKKQFDAVRALIPGVDFDAIARLRKTAYDDRTLANRLADEAKTRARAIDLPPGPDPEPVDTEKLTAELARAGDHNSRVERLTTQRSSLQSIIADLEATLTRRRAELDSIGAIPERIDTIDIQAKLSNARETNALATRAKERAALLDEARNQVSIADYCTKEIAKLDKKKADAIAAASFPVPGLSFGDEVVLLNGVPFEQASDAERLRASIAIAAAMSPKLKVIRVRDGSLLDSDAMAELARYAETNGLQIWVERVDTSGSVGFVIEDGRLKGQALAEPSTSQPAHEELEECPLG